MYNNKKLSLAMPAYKASLTLEQRTYREIPFDLVDAKIDTVVVQPWQYRRCS